MIRFVPVVEITKPRTLAIGLSGGSGTGKTFTALRLARGIAETVTGKKGAPIGYVDTENNRALHYRETFPEMMHFDFTALDADGKLAGFGVNRWIEVIDAAEEAKLPVVILDSFSHAWEGVGGVLDVQAQVLDRMVREAEARNQQYNNTTPVDPGKYGQLAWAEVKPRYRRLIDRIVRANTNVIICTRAKPVMQKGFGVKAENARATKTRRKDVPWDPASDADLMFEMTVMTILDPSAPGCPVHQIKVADQFKGLFNPKCPMSEGTGRGMAEWAKGESAAHKEKEMMDLARDKARVGKVAFMEWWNSDDGKAARPIVRPIMDEITALCTTADELAALSDDNPFDTAAEGPDDENRGEAHAFDADQIIAFIDAKVTISDVNNLVASHVDTIAEFSQDDRERVANAQAGRIAELKGAAK